MDRDNFFPAKYTGSKSLIQQDIHSANATGFGAAADDFMERGIDLNEELINNKPATFFMRVSSDAMKEAGIYKGDVAIVDRSVKATNGKVIIAILNGDMLIRRFEKTNNNIRLITDSNKLSVIHIDDTCEEFAIWGVVTYVIHRP
ncbi:MAG: translesion error-prone DNA polymerase V autoproteolytic subunit [Ginsengibacter sp.]